MIGNPTRHFGGNIGSSSNLNLLPQPLGFLFGINVVGVVVLLYLIRASRFASGEFLDCAPPPVKRISVLVEERSTGPNDAPDHIRLRIVVSRRRSTRLD